MSESKDGGDPAKRQGRDDRSAAKGIPQSANGAMRDAGQPEARKREKIQRQLDEALADSFPASDPVSIVTSNEEEDWGDAPAGGPVSDDRRDEGDSQRVDPGPG